MRSPIIWFTLIPGIDYIPIFLFGLTCACVLLPTHRHPLHAVSVPILHPREIPGTAVVQALWYDVQRVYPSHSLPLPSPVFVLTGSCRGCAAVRQSSGAAPSAGSTRREKTLFAGCVIPPSPPPFPTHASLPMRPYPRLTTGPSGGPFPL